MNYKAGDKLGSYTLLAECGKGAYGSVFLAENALTRQQVALKIVYHAGRNSDRELKGLIKYQNLCKHTNLLQIYHVGGKENFFFYTMDAADNRNTPGDYVPDTLAKRLKENGRLAPEVVKKMAQELLGDLNVLHNKGLFHRDIKPDNILWIDGKATLGDIGLVTDLNHHQTGEEGKQESITISEVHNHLYGAVCSLEHLNFPLRMCQRAKRRYRLQFFMGNVAHVEQW